MTKRKKRKQVKCKRKKRRRPAPHKFATEIKRVLDDLRDRYDGGTQHPAYFSAVTVVAGTFVWAIENGCPPHALTGVMNEALQLALQNEQLSVECMVAPAVVDPKAVN